MIPRPGIFAAAGLKASKFGVNSCFLWVFYKTSAARI